MERVLNGRYEVRDAIGAGGAATVYRATDRQLCRDVAVKLLDDVAARSADPGGRERFLREARTGAAVRHHNLVDVFDAGEDDGVLYLVMELVHGRSLAALIATSAPLPVDEAVRITTQILAGLSALHTSGTIHRDVKPANVLIDDAGHVRLSDFGIAKRLDDIEGALTSDGTVVGTPTYLAPEQAAGGPLSAATDIYAVGLVLYEMLTGQRHLRAGCVSCSSPNGRVATLDPQSIGPDVPEHISQAIVRATLSNPADRYADADSMIEALTGTSPAVPAAVATRVLPLTASLPDHRHPTRPTPRQPTPTLVAPASLLVEETGPAVEPEPTRATARIVVTVLALCLLIVGGLVIARRLGSDSADSDIPQPTDTTTTGTVVQAEPLPSTSLPIATPPPTTAVPPPVLAEPAPTANSAPARGAPPSDKAKGAGRGKDKKNG